MRDRVNQGIEARQGAEVERFAQIPRGEQAQRNVVRRRENAQATARRADNLRRQDTQRRIAARDSGQELRPMGAEYDTVVNEGRVPVSGLARNTVRPGRPNSRLQGPRRQNTLDGRRVVADSENRAIRDRARRRTQARIDLNQEEIQLRNQLAGNAAFQRMSVDLARGAGNEQLAEANQARVAARNRIAGNPNRQRGAVNRGRRIGNEQLGEANQARVAARSGQAQPTSRTATSGPRAPGRENTINPRKVEANRTNQVNKAAIRRTKKAEAERKRIAEAKAKRSSAGLNARQGTKAAPASATYKSGTQPKKGGQEGSRLFTPRNRAEAAQRAGSKLNPRQSNAQTNRAVAAGKVAYANKLGNIRDIGFKSTNDSKAYARDAERRQKGAKVTRLSRAKSKLNAAAIRNNLATVFSHIKEGDKALAMPLEGIKGRMGRAKVYEKLSKGALKTDDSGAAQAKRLAGNKWKNSDGEIKEWNPEDLRKDIKALTKATPEQLRGKAIGGNSQLRVKGKRIPGTKVSSGNQSRPKANTKATRKRQGQALSRITNLAKKKKKKAE